MRKKSIWSHVFLFFVIIQIYACARPGNISINNAKANESDTKWKMGVASWSFHKFPFAEALRKADSCDLKYMEISAGFEMGRDFNDTAFVLLSPEGIRKAEKLMNENGIKMISTYADGSTVAEWKRNFEFAKRLGLLYITGEPSITLLASIDSLAALYHIPVALHNHWQGASQYWSADTVLSITNRYTGIKACADIGHWVRSGLDPVECLRKLKGKILGVHLKDVSESGNSKAEDKVPGTGIIDFVKVAGELKRQRYDGMIYVECELNWYNNVPDVKESIRFFNAASKDFSTK